MGRGERPIRSPAEGWSRGLHPAAGVRMTNRAKRSASDEPGSARRAVILLYHQVATVTADPWRLAVPPDVFRQQMEVIAQSFRPLSLTEIAEGIRGGRCPPHAVAVTFDDGYANNLRDALPALALHGIPATVFVATGYVGTRREFWWDELARAILGTAAGRERPPLTVSLGRSILTCPRAPAAQVLAVARSWLYRRDPTDISRALEQVRAWAGLADDAVPREAYRPMNAGELDALSRSELIELGAHTRSHPVLAGLHPARQAEEINGSIADLERLTGRAPATFAYPFGAPGRDYTHATARLVEDSGIDVAVSTRGLPVTASSSRYELPRFFAGDLPPDAFERWLTHCFVPRRALPARAAARRLYALAAGNRRRARDQSDNGGRHPNSSG
jgi:peptidoglycan/xylan/chitin deacetylase (PgdA/CDA1 family)